jgi:hypothetical protein
VNVVLIGPMTKRLRASMVAGLALAVVFSAWPTVIAQTGGQGSPTLTAQDYIDVQQLYARYAHALDSFEREGAGWAETFTPDGVFSRNTVGYAALVAFAKNWRENRGGAFLQHWNNQLVITPTAQGARGSAYMMLVDRRTTPPSIMSVYEYDDELVRTAGGWRFKSRSFVTLPAVK